MQSSWVETPLNQLVNPCQIEDPLSLLGNFSYKKEGCEVVHSLEDAIKLIKDKKACFLSLEEHKFIKRQLIRN